MRHLCPECSSDHRERIQPRGIVERVAELLGWHVYRCMDCGNRYHDRSVPRRVS